MLGGRISTQDEDEVEDELEALEREMAPPSKDETQLPTVPDANLPVSERPQEQPEREDRQEAMLAA